MHTYKCDLNGFCYGTISLINYCRHESHCKQQVSGNKIKLVRSSSEHESADVGNRDRDLSRYSVPIEHVPAVHGVILIDSCADLCGVVVASKKFFGARLHLSDEKLV